MLTRSDSLKLDRTGAGAQSRLQHCASWIRWKPLPVFQTYAFPLGTAWRLSREQGRASTASESMISTESASYGSRMERTK